MPLTNVGCNLLASLIIGAGAPFNAANALLVVGDGSDAFNSSQTYLTGDATFSKGMNAGYPQELSNVLTFQTTFATNEANFNWQEWGISNGFNLLNRMVESLGVKASTQSWQLTVQLTVSTS
jgi:hypothetical protein